MNGTITKIHQPKESKNGKYIFIRVEFRLEDGTWAKTDLCPTFHNYKHWKNFLTVGTELGELKMKAPGEVNADSHPYLPSK